jgi:hypothetical protein
MPENGLGNIELGLTADNTQHNQALREAEVAAERYADKADAASKRASASIEQGLESVSGGLKTAAKRLEGFVKGFALVAAVVVGAYELGKAIREGIVSALESGTEKAIKFKDALDMSKPKEALAATRKEIATLEAQLSQSLEGGHGMVGRFLFGEANPEKLQEQLRELRRTAKGLQDAENAQERDKRRKQEEKDITELERMAADAKAQSMDEAQRIGFESERKVAELRKRLESENRPRVREAIEEAISWEYQRRNVKEAELATKREEEARKKAEAERRAEEEKDKTVADQRNTLAAQLLEGEERVRFDTVRALAELEIQLDKETSEERRKLIREEMDLRRQLEEKLLSDLFAKQFAELKRMAQQLEQGNNNVVFSLGAITQQLDSIITRLSGP